MKCLQKEQAKISHSLSFALTISVADDNTDGQYVPLQVAHNVIGRFPKYSIDSYNTVCSLLGAGEIF